MALRERVELDERVTVTCRPPAFHWIRAAPSSGVTLTFVTSAGAGGGGGIGSGGGAGGGRGSTMRGAALNGGVPPGSPAPKGVGWVAAGRKGGAVFGAAGGGGAVGG